MQSCRNWVGKGAQATGMTASLRILSRNADSDTWESFTRNGMKLESVHQESPCSDFFRKRDTKPRSGDWRKTGEVQNPSFLKSSVKFLKSVMIWGTVTSAGVGPLCFIKYKVNAAIYQEILEHFMLPSANKIYGFSDFLFQQDFSTWLPTVPKPLPSGLLTKISLCLIGQPTCLT